MHENGFNDLAESLVSTRNAGMYRRRRQVESAQGRILRIEGKEVLNFCSNDYLGLAADPRIISAFQDALAYWGSGSGASHLVCGHTSAHEELEEELADFTGRPRALLYSSGYAANVGVINALLSEGDFVFEDRLNHASLLDGGWISRAKFSWYEHVDVEDLRKGLTAVETESTRKLIVSDATFSMDGDLCPLDSLIVAARESRGWLMIDDAHGIGVHGPNGVGLVDPALYSTEDVPILIGTLGKAFGVAGAFVAGTDALIETLIQRSRNYIFTTAMPSAMAVATKKSLRIVQQEEWRRERIRKLVTRFRAGASELGFAILPSESPIQPLVVGDPVAAVEMSKKLEENRCLCTAIRPPTVPVGTSRLRITFTAAHELQDVDDLLDALSLARGMYR